VCARADESADPPLLLYYSLTNECVQGDQTSRISATQVYVYSTGGGSRV
jgi:hypothetical protein